MKTTKSKIRCGGMSTIVVLALGLMVLPASVAKGAQYLTVNGQPVDSITLELGQSCTVEVVSDDSTSYVAYVGFDNGRILGSFSHLETRTEAGNLATVAEYHEPAFYGYYVQASGLRPPPPSKGVHFVFEYVAQQVGETDLKLYLNDPPPLALKPLDSVHITVIPLQPKPMGTAFTYQGRLLDVNSLADGLYDFQFKLYDNADPVFAAQQGSTIDINDLDVIDGQFAIELDFGSDVFAGDARWLETAVRPGDSNDPNAFVTLSPLVELTPTPYALYAETAGGDNDWRVSENNMYAIPSGTVSVSRSTDAAGPGLKVLRSATYPLIFQKWMEIDTDSIDTYTRSVQTTGSPLKLNSNSNGSVVLAQGGGSVGIGTSNPLSKLSVGGDGIADTGVYGSGSTHGVYGNGTTFGVYGIGSSVGVWGEDSDNGSSGRLGFATYGVYGSGSIHGVYGSGSSKGVWGFGPTGVYGQASGSSGHGVSGYAAGETGRAVYGWADDNGGTNYGGHFTADGVTGRGVYGLSTGSDGIGVVGGAINGVGVSAQSLVGTGLVARTFNDEAYAAEFYGNVLIRNLVTEDPVIELGEGLDYAEGFDVSESTKIDAGSVLIIDAENPGKLAISDKAYDSKVAGIVAGAKGMGSGVRLGSDEFDCDVALAGRVYCNVDATDAPVEPGDLLTTSMTPGYAMKAADYMRAQGAILGKAMESLQKGKKGQILVLVTLQ